MAWYSGITDFLLGESPEDVALPEEVKAAQARREDLLKLYEQPTDVPGDTAQKAAELAGRRASDQLAAKQRSIAAGARGVGGLAARRQAAALSATGEQAIAGSTAEQMARAAIADQQAQQDAETRRRQAIERLLSQQEAAAYGGEQYRAQTADQGFLPALAGIGGAAIGGLAGGPQGAQIGGQIGYGAGSAITQGLR